jgi:hypothetical protein
LDRFELIEGFTLVLGGSGCGFSVTFEPGLLNFDAGLLNFDPVLLFSEPGCAFFPETIIIDLCPDVEACASTVAAWPAVTGSEEPCSGVAAAMTGHVVSRIAVETT